MTLTFSGKETAPADILAETEELYRDIAGELARAIRDVREGRADAVKVAGQAMKDLRAALQMCMDERTRVEKLRKQDGSGAAGGVLDFAAARDEIGRRLARLRDAGDG